jgi:hypothetical protein
VKKPLSKYSFPLMMAAERKSMSKILLVWQAIPEETSCYVLDKSSEIGSLALQSAGLYINGADEIKEGDPIDRLNDMLPQLPKIASDAPLIGPFDTVVICGFLC